MFLQLASLIDCSHMVEVLDLIRHRCSRSVKSEHHCEDETNDHDVVEAPDIYRYGPCIIVSFLRADRIIVKFDAFRLDGQKISSYP